MFSPGMMVLRTSKDAVGEASLLKMDRRSISPRNPVGSFCRCSGIEIYRWKHLFV